MPRIVVPAEIVPGHEKVVGEASQFPSVLSMVPSILFFLNIRKNCKKHNSIQKYRCKEPYRSFHLIVLHFDARKFHTTAHVDDY